MHLFILLPDYPRTVYGSVPENHLPDSHPEGCHVNILYFELFNFCFCFLEQLKCVWILLEELQVILKIYMLLLLF